MSAAWQQRARQVKVAPSLIRISNLQDEIRTLISRQGQKLRELQACTQSHKAGTGASTEFGHLAHALAVYEGVSL